MTRTLKSPPASSSRARAVMRGNRRRDTSLERRVRSRLHATGLRYRVDYRVDCEGSRVHVDIAFTRRRIAVFVDGCFWHGCDRHPRSPKTNLDYWIPKIDRNRARDATNTIALRQAGWTVIRGWEHEPVDQIADRVICAVVNQSSMRLDAVAAGVAMRVRSALEPLRQATA
ncbi:MAG: very short patch repair endonuclease [Chloroflexi bacterium]|nr:very short patch repair endonuclease [Chloroflexota bacterium]